MTCADIIEFGAYLLQVACSQDATAYSQTKTSNAEKIFENAKGAIEGCLQADSVLREINQLHAVLRGKPPKAAKKKSKK